MHVDELDIDQPVVRRLLAEQFPEWAGMPLARVEPSGTDNAIFRLGDELAVRIPRRDGSTTAGSKELDWLARLAPIVPVEIPVPVAQGAPGAGYPWFWEFHTWVDGATGDVEELDAVQAAVDLAAIVRALQLVEPEGAPPGRGNPLAERDAEMQGWLAEFDGDPPSQASGSARSRRNPGMARRCGITAISTCATGSCATAASPA